MILKLFIASVLLVEIICAGTVEETEREVSFSIEQTWQSYKTIDAKHSCTCQSNAEWKKGVQEYYTGVRTAYWTFQGPAYHLADNVIQGFEKYLTHLIYLASTNSTVLQPCSTDILEGFSKLNKLRDSATVILVEFNKAFPGLIETFKKVVNKLGKYIGRLTGTINNALDRFRCVLVDFQTEFLKLDSHGIRKNVQYTPVIEQGLVVVNTIALIAETLLTQCEGATPEQYEAVTILILILNYSVFVVEGINACQQSVLYEENRAVPKKLETSSISLDYYVMVAITQSVTSITFPFVDSLISCLTVVVNLIVFLNSALKELCGVFKGVLVTVAEIQRNLLGSVSNTVNKGLSKLLKGVPISKTQKALLN